MPNATGILDDHLILKTELVVKEAWQIGENDPDGIVMMAGDPPYVPPHVLKPPVDLMLKELLLRAALTKR
jgi:hypothetical protein